MRACACCGELTFLNESKVVAIDDAWAAVLRTRLVWMDHLPQGLRDDYDLFKQAGASWNFLRGVPLSERGTVSVPAGPPRLRFYLRLWIHHHLETGVARRQQGSFECFCGWRSIIIL